MSVFRAMAIAFVLAGGCAGTVLAEGDPVKGEQQFGSCSACHTVQADGPNMMGPNLHSVFGKKAGTNRTNFAYSTALKTSGLVWNEQTLNKWITSPADLAPGTKMEFVGIARAATRANIIAYLKKATQ